MPAGMISIFVGERFTLSRVNFEKNSKGNDPPKVLDKAKKLTFKEFNLESHRAQLV